MFSAPQSHCYSPAISDLNSNQRHEMMSTFLQTTRAIVQHGKRLARTARGADWWPRIDRRVRTLRFGANGAAWTVAVDFLCRDSVVWSVGVGEDISFDEELHDHFGVRIDAFDPTPRSLKWLQARGVPSWFHLHPIGLAGQDGAARFRPPAKASHVSFAMLNEAVNLAGAADITVDVRCLTTLASQLGHRAIDLLKMDIEGAEYDVIHTLSTQRILPRQLLVEFHHRHPDCGIRKTISATKSLRSMGYSLFHISPNGEEYAFLHDDAVIDAPRLRQSVSLHKARHV
jgi:FkbM family methyltransferase